MREPVPTAKLPSQIDPPQSPIVEEFGRIDDQMNLAFDKLERLERLLIPILTPETPQAQGGQNVGASDTQLHQRLIEVTMRINSLNIRLAEIIHRIQL